MSRLCAVFWRHFLGQDMADSSMAIILNDLSDYDLLTLMDSMALEDLLRLAGASRRFYMLAKRSQSTRRQLGVMINPKPISSSSRYKNGFDIVTPTLTHSHIDRILANLPGVTDLFIFQYTADSENLEVIIVLLERLSTQLKSLELRFLKAFDQPTSMQPLLAATNGLVKLSNLKLTFHIGTLFTDNEPAIVHLPIISQLAHFEFTSNCNVNPLLVELIQRATATDTLPQISIRAQFDAPSLELLKGMSPTLAKHFTALTVASTFANFTDLTNMCNKFQNLTSVGFDANHLTTGQIAANLAKLPHLTSVIWMVEFANRVQWRQEEVALLRFGERPEPDIRDSGELVPLPQVTELVLILDIAKHDDLALLHLGTLFPNVTRLKLCIHSCVQCSFDGAYANEGLFIAKRRCIIKMINYWMVFPKLVKIYEDDYNPLPSFIWKPHPLLGVSRAHLYYAIDKIFEPMGKIVDQCYTWITNMFTSD